ncbi:MAG: diguanylate phosphodiesterase [Alphaproteobacteria bacterium]|nr:MAG: diguanylate phosphodiesterase [Alphaproteobacteria bacterium]
MNKEQIYLNVAEQIKAVTEGETNIIARMATISCLLPAAFPDFFWTGFYIVDEEKPDELVIGPYQGSLGCLRIAFGRGVCGTAATTRQTQLVDNVHDFPGHIACDSRSQSEIVVPVFNQAGNLMALLDIDSEKPANFDEVDKRYLEQITDAAFRFKSGCL